MRCPSCGAVVNSAFCEYCGTKMPVEQVETQSIHADNVVVNNYYYSNQPSDPAEDMNSSGQVNRNANAAPHANAATYASAVGPVSSKSRLIASLLCFFLGIFGAHRFYVGRYAIGVLFLVTFGGFGFAWLVDMVLVLIGKMRDRDGLYVSNW